MTDFDKALWLFQRISKGIYIEIKSTSLTDLNGPEKYVCLCKREY